MVKKALCVGISYLRQEHQLYGCINDCLNWTKLLEDQFSFDEVRVLIDQNPDGTDATAPTQIPTKNNILAQLGWLCSNIEPGDTLAFVFAGHGCQVRSQFNSAGEVDEALVPADFDALDADGNPQLVFDDELHALFARLPAGSFVTVILDCCHGGQMLDVPCMLDTSVRPPKMTQECLRPREVFTRNEASWNKNPHALARPRFRQSVQMRGRMREKRTEPGMGAHLGRMTLNPGVTAFMFAACNGAESALDANIKSHQQGVMSFCLQEALMSLRHRCTYQQLLDKACEFLEDIRDKYMQTMDQHISLSFSPNSAPTEAVFCDERYATLAQYRLHQGNQLAERGQSADQSPYDQGPPGQPQNMMQSASTDFVPMPGYNAPRNMSSYPAQGPGHDERSSYPNLEPTRPDMSSQPREPANGNYSYGGPPPDVPYPGLAQGGGPAPTLPGGFPQGPPPGPPSAPTGNPYDMGGMGGPSVGAPPQPSASFENNIFKNMFGAPSLFTGLGGAPPGGAPNGQLAPAPVAPAAPGPGFGGPNTATPRPTLPMPTASSVAQPAAQFGQQQGSQFGPPVQRGISGQYAPPVAAPRGLSGQMPTMAHAPAPVNQYAANPCASAASAYPKPPHALGGAYGGSASYAPATAAPQAYGGAGSYAPAANRTIRYG